MSELQQGSSDQQPDPVESEFTMLTQDLETEYTGLSGELRNFDVARHELYSFIEEFMQGTSGKSFDESLGSLASLTTQSINAFKAASLALSQEIEDKDAAISAVVDLLIRDEKERIAKFKGLNPKADFTLSQTTHLTDLLQSISSSEDAMDHVGVIDPQNPLPELSTHTYMHTLEADLNSCIADAPPNVYEQLALKRLRRNSMIKEAVLDIGKVAAGTVVALWVNDRLRRR